MTGQAKATPVEHCRACGSTALFPVLNMGLLSQAGTFPRVGAAAIELPLALCQCGTCQLLQLEHTYPKSLLFEETYGYRSGLNAGMVGHLESVAQDLLERFPIKDGDTILDIGANDGTFLRAFPGSFRKIAVDPGMNRYGQYYDGIEGKIVVKVKGYFPECSLPIHAGQAKLISSIAMFYDVDHPKDFMEKIRELLAVDGIWYCEQLYGATMIEQGIYDTICHEHACYYTLNPLLELAEAAGLKVIDVSFNPTNGGSIGVIFARVDSQYEEALELNFLLTREAKICAKSEIEAFGPNAVKHAQFVYAMLTDLIVNKRKSVYGMGASTKGNVLLQLARLSALVRMIGDVNPDKFGCRTPGTHIPIIPENDVLVANPDYLLILPWHFREGMIERYAPYIRAGGKLIFPFPKVEIYP